MAVERIGDVSRPMSRMKGTQRMHSTAPTTPDALHPLGMIDERIAVALPGEDHVVAPPLDSVDGGVTAFTSS